jgi:hypothetical protein
MLNKRQRFYAPHSRGRPSNENANFLKPASISAATSLAVYSAERGEAGVNYFAQRYPGSG